MSLNEEESNPWIPPNNRQINKSLGTPDTGSLITKKMPLKDTMDRPLRNLYEETSNLRFRLDIKDKKFNPDVFFGIPKVF